MTAYILRQAADPKGESAVIVSIGPDDLSCQSEILAYYRKYESSKDSPQGIILGFYVVDKTHTRKSWLEDMPDDIRRGVVLAKSEIEKAGFESFHHGEYDFDGLGNEKRILIGRPRMIEQFKNRTAIETSIAERGGKDGMKLVLKKLGPDLEAALANPLHAGIHPDFPAVVHDEIWIQDAVGCLKAIGADRWMRAMVHNLREYFGGRPREIVPNKNDRCICKSGKKYGKCCGEGVQESDPEDCKLGRHQYGDWVPGLGGRYYRGCQKCLKIEDAPYAEEVELEGGQKIILVGCNTCQKAPTPEDAQKLSEEWKAWWLCSLCGNPFTIKKAVCAHNVTNEGVHVDRWSFVTMYAGQETRECRYTGADGNELMVMAHVDCFEKAFKHIPKVTQLKPVKQKDGYIVKRETQGARTDA